VFAGKTLQGPLYTVSPIIPGGPWNYAGRRPANTFDIDTATAAFYEWPLNRYIGQLLRRGELPLWNPHQGTGVPVVVNYSTRALFPFQAALDVTPTGAWDFFFLLRLWIAGVLTYLFLTRAGLGWTPAMFGGLSYMLSGAFVWFINLEQYVNVAMVVPAWFLAVEVLVAKANARGAAGAGLALGLVLLAGQPEIAFYALVVGGLYGVMRVACTPSGRASLWRAIGWGAIGVATGLALAAAQLLPFAAHLSSAIHLHQAGGDMGVRDPAPVNLAIQIFVPSFYELPTALRIRPDNGRWDLLGGYAGILAVFVAAAGLVVPRWRVGPTSRSPAIFFSVVTSWLLLKNFGVPPFDWIGYLPLFDQVWTPRWSGPTWCFSLAAAAAFGLQRVMETEMNAAGRARLGIVAAGALVLVGGLAGIGFTTLAPVQDSHGPFIWPGAIGGWLLGFALVGLAGFGLGQCSGATLSVALLALLVIERWLPIPRGYLPLFLALRMVPIVVGLAAVAFLIFRRRTAARGVALLALALGLVLDPLAPIGLPDRVDPAAPPPVVQFLRERSGYDRITGDHRVLAPNYASVFGLYDVRHVDALSVAWSYGYVTEALETEPRPWWHALWFVGDPHRRGPAVDPAAPTPLEQDLRARLRGHSLAGVRYIVAPRGMDLNRLATSEADRFPLVYDHEVLVYENRAAFPRAFSVARWESAPDAATARARALSSTFDPRTSAVIEGVAAGTGGEGTVRIVEYGAGRVRLSVDLARPGLVVLTDTFYPGWDAQIDGLAAPIHRVNGVFRGVFVESGPHVVTMRFRPASQIWGLAMSTAGLAALIGLVSASGRPGRRPGAS
jgi:hypothetical protein